MHQKYTTEENVLQLISLLKAHSISKIVASPGNTNITFVGSVQNDPFLYGKTIPEIDLTKSRTHLTSLRKESICFLKASLHA